MDQLPFLSTLSDSERLCFYGILIISISAWTPVPLSYGQLQKTYLGIEINPQISWFIYELPNLIAVVLVSFSKNSVSIFENPINYIKLLPFVIHYIYRALIYPFKAIGSDKKVPIQIVLSAVVFTSFNGYLQSSCLLDRRNAESQWHFASLFSGYLIFYFGRNLNLQCDQILFQLKRKILSKKSEQKTVTQYGIPEGVGFQFVSCPHYLGQTIEWLGYWVLTQKFSGFVFFMATFTVLLQRALDCHKWYHEQFQDYPKQRKAMIPFII